MLSNLTPPSRENLLTQRRSGAEQYAASLRRCVSMILLILLCAIIAFGQQRSSSNTQQSDANATFRSARDLITDGEWARAQEKFSEYVNTYQNEKNLDAALYWLAYTQ